jgi:hypothetical protein
MRHSPHRLRPAFETIARTAISRHSVKTMHVHRTAAEANGPSPGRPADVSPARVPTRLATSSDREVSTATVTAKENLGRVP